MLELAGLNRGALDKYPHEFSGGQRQRLALARALVLEPEMVIADEPVSSLDVSVQAQILNLMKDLKKKFSLTYIFIAHDLGTVDYFCDSLLVMYQGEMMETGDKSILKDPFHPYTRLLLNSLPGVRKNPEPPLSKVHFDSKCPFFERCPVRYDKCAGYTGRYYTLSPGHQTTCVRGEK
jgi:oligopeptide/dipeptide ABC transporter ATP-binding protein